MPKIILKPGEFKKYCEESKPLDPFVLYSPITERVALSFCNKGRRREVDILGSKGIFFIKRGYLDPSYVVIGRLIGGRNT